MATDDIRKEMEKLRKDRKTLHALGKFARIYSVGTDWSWDDLLSLAFLATLYGEEKEPPTEEKEPPTEAAPDPIKWPSRPWKRKVGLDQHLIGVMRSLRSNQIRTEKRRAELRKIHLV